MPMLHRSQSRLSHCQKSVTKELGDHIFWDECNGDWFHLLARHLHAYLPAEVSNVPLTTNEVFLESNVYGRLRRRGLVHLGNCTPC